MNFPHVPWNAELARTCPEYRAQRKYADLRWLHAMYADGWITFRELLDACKRLKAFYLALTGER